MTSYHPLFANKVLVTEGGCWKWLGNISPQGYGMTRIPGEKTPDGKSRRTTAHRWAYEQKHGKPASGLVLDHLCRNRWCCNPDHVEPVTQRENLYRSPLYMNRDKPRTVAMRSRNGVNTYELQLAFAKARTRFAEMGIRKPMPFIEWKRPDLTEEQRNQLMFALCGRVSPKHADLLPVVEKVLEELQAA